jgi:hypothetical protein
MESCLKGKEVRWHVTVNRCCCIWVHMMYSSLEQFVWVVQRSAFCCLERTFRLAASLSSGLCRTTDEAAFCMPHLFHFVRVWYHVSVRASQVCGLEIVRQFTGHDGSVGLVNPTSAVRFPGVAQLFLLTTASRPAVGPIQPPAQICLSGVIWPGRET